MAARDAVYLALGLLCVGLEAGYGAQNPAQTAEHRKQNPSPTSTVAVEGTVESVGKTGFKINVPGKRPGRNKPGKNKPGKNKLSGEWFVTPTKSTKWVVIGTAEPSYLQVGQTVLFKATLDEEGQPDDKVSSLTIVPARGNSPSIRVDDGSGPMRPKAPGIGVGVLPTDTQVKKIVGKIRACVGMRLVVNAGKVIKVELAENPTIDVILPDHTLMAVGSKIRAHGTPMATKKLRYLEPDNITVTLATRLTGKEKPSDLTPPDEPAIPKETMTPGERRERGRFPGEATPEVTVAVTGRFAITRGKVGPVQFFVKVRA